VVHAVAAGLGVRLRRRVPVLVDGIALAAAARECMTVMKGDWGTMRVVHRPADTAGRLALSGVRQVAASLAATLSAR